MALGNLLDQIREYYVSRFVDAINERAAVQGVSVVHETALCNAEGEIATEGQLELPARVDMFVLRDGEVSDSLQIDTAEMLSFEPITFDWPEQLQVELHPFQWNWLQLRVYGLQPQTDWTPIREWFLRWFHEQDPSEGELLGGVHFVSDPERGDRFSQISIDLGTAPVEAFEELLDALDRIHTDRVEMGQFDEVT